MGMHSFPIFIHYQIKFFTIFHRGHPSHIFEKLSISEVASQLGCTELELSQLLNSHMKVNFANFINVYRVKDVRIKLSMCIWKDSPV